MFEMPKVVIIKNSKPQKDVVEKAINTPTIKSCDSWN